MKETNKKFKRKDRSKIRIRRFKDQRQQKLN